MPQFLRRSLCWAPLLLMVSAGNAATILVLTDGNAMFRVEDTGMSGWTLTSGGQNVMPQQWFWFRTGTTANNQGALQSMDSLGAPNVTFDSAFPDFGELQYQSPTLGADLTLDVIDGQPVVLAEQVQWTNRTSQTLYLTVFQYIHFAFSPVSDSLTISQNRAIQSGSAGDAEVVVSPFDSTYAGYQAGSSSAILGALTNSATSATFNVNNHGSAAGDVGMAFQWNATLAPGASLTMSIGENASPSPEPSSALLIAAGVLALGGRRFLKNRA
jgi:hypothetical protein